MPKKTKLTFLIVNNQNKLKVFEQIRKEQLSEKKCDILFMRVCIYKSMLLVIPPDYSKAVDEKLKIIDN